MIDNTPNQEIKSVNDKDHIKATEELMLENFLVDSRPWVVAYSGGKDSTLVLQLVYRMLLNLPPDKLKPVYIISSDTQVEPPNISSYIENSLFVVTEHAKKHSLPICAIIVKPGVENGFWGNLIGKGYPPPTRWFRWCTSKMKIKPVKARLENVIKQFGSIIILLGNRKAESSTRGQNMQAREYSSRKLALHTEIPNTLVLSPIAEWSNEQVWEYLYNNNPSPWGGDHSFMLNLYRQANGGECPIITDLNTPSCGGSRFGCWTCTVVKEDKSMSGFIENGEEWMLPLNRFRNWLKEIRGYDHLRSKYKRDGRPGPGPFTSEARTMILESLLDTERSIGIELISDKEILYIQNVWNEDFDFNFSALRIAKRFNRQPRCTETEECGI